MTPSLNLYYRKLDLEVMETGAAYIPQGQRTQSSLIFAGTNFTPWHGKAMIY